MRTRGFTIAEVLVAMVVLAVGVLGLVTTAALVTRMVRRSWRTSERAVLANERLEWLEAAACATPQADSEARGASVVAWRVREATSGRGRHVQIIVRDDGGQPAVADTIDTFRTCP